MSIFFIVLGALAMETLHRQVLPFILRRLKEDVLQDLPPKIIQDYYCDLSPLQVSYVLANLFTSTDCLYCLCFGMKSNALQIQAEFLWILRLFQVILYSQRDTTLVES